MKSLVGKSAVAVVTLAVACSLAGCSPSTSPTASTDGTVETIVPGVVRVGSQSDNKPYSFVNDNKDLGYTIELVQDIAKRLNLKTQIVYLDFSALIPSVVSGSIDIAASSISDTAEREKIVDFSDPILFGPQAVLAAKEGGVTSDPASLAGKRLAVVQGTVQDSYATAHWKANVVRFPDQNSQYAALKTGSVDALFGDQPLAAEAEASNSSLEIVLSIPDETSPFAIVFNKKNADLKDAFNKELKSLIADGTVERLQDKYLPGVPINDMFKAE